MIYTLDLEFLEGAQNKTFLGFNIGKTKPTIDLISIGIYAEDDREYYAISKDFNIKEAWNRYDKRPELRNGGFEKVYWIRESVLRPIFVELLAKELDQHKRFQGGQFVDDRFTLSNFTYLVNIYGKHNHTIAEEVKTFVKEKPIFYAYYADYDWVGFCWLFGKMIDLPKGFPFYCRDLKQIADNIWESTGKDTRFESPKSEHNAIADARWNMDFLKFLRGLGYETRKQQD
jgi:hypothetical protein